MPQLINWTYSNFSYRCRVDTPLFMVLRRIGEQHNRITDLKVYKGSVAKENLLTDELASLKSLGFPGAPLGVEPPASVVLHYDFKPVDLQDPLLLA